MGLQLGLSGPFIAVAVAVAVIATVNGSLVCPGANNSRNDLICAAVHTNSLCCDDDYQTTCAGVCCATTCTPPPSAPVARIESSSYGGVLAQLPSYNGAVGTTYGIVTTTAAACTMRLWKTAGGAARTTTTVALSGISVDGLAFSAHLHSQPCAQNGGGHYMNDPSGLVDAVNENWPMLSCTGTLCSGEGTTMWQPTAAAIASGLSIVIHDTPSAASGSGAKYMCADLALAVADDGLRTHSGPLGRLTSYTHEAGDTYDIATNTASATMRRWTTAGGAARTTTTVAFRGSGVTGLVFFAHLHSQPCAQDGGGHYKNNPFGPVDAVNENWPTVSCTDTVCTGQATTQWYPDNEAVSVGLSIVVHDSPDTATGTGGAKFMCADMALPVGTQDDGIVPPTPAPTPAPTESPLPDTPISSGDDTQDGSGDDGSGSGSGSGDDDNSGDGGLTLPTNPTEAWPAGPGYVETDDDIYNETLSESDVFFSETDDGLTDGSVALIVIVAVLLVGTLAAAVMNNTKKQHQRLRMGSARHAPRTVNNSAAYVNLISHSEQKTLRVSHV